MRAAGWELQDWALLRRGGLPWPMPSRCLSPGAGDRSSPGLPEPPVTRPGGEFWQPLPLQDSAPPPEGRAGWAASIPSFPPARPIPIAGGPFPCSGSAAVPSFAQFTDGATFPKIQFFSPSLGTLHLVQPFPVTPAPALLQLDSKNNLFIQTAHAIISQYSSGRRGVIPLSRDEITEY